MSIAGKLVRACTAVNGWLQKYYRLCGRTGFDLPGDLKSLPAPRTKLFNGDKEVGYITSSTLSPKHGGMVGMAYVRKEANTPGQELQFAEPGGGTVQVVGRPEGGSS